MAKRKRNIQVKSWVTEEEKRLIDEKMAQLPTQSDMDANGVMQTGWLQQGSTWYYLKSNGVMASNETLTMNGKTYKFSSTGAWIQ